MLISIASTNKYKMYGDVLKTKVGKKKRQKPSKLGLAALSSKEGGGGGGGEKKQRQHSSASCNYLVNCTPNLLANVNL